MMKFAKTLTRHPAEEKQEILLHLLSMISHVHALAQLLAQMRLSFSLLIAEIPFGTRHTANFSRMETELFSLLATFPTGLMTFVMQQRGLIR